MNKGLNGPAKETGTKIVSKYVTPAKLVPRATKAPDTFVEQYLSKDFIAQVDEVNPVTKTLHRATPTSPLSLTNELDENWVEPDTKRPLPQAREPVPETVHLALWHDTIDEPGKLNATKVETLFVAHRDQSKTIEELSKDFKLDKKVLDNFFKYCAAPHLDYDNESKLYYGTLEKKYRVV